MDETEFFAHLKEHIDNYPALMRASKDVYSDRLEVCKMCDELSDGMCRKCGCYVQLRAVKKKMYCPDKKW